MSQDVKNTLNLPKTDFPMRASLPQREPASCEKWDSEKLYYQMIEKNQGKPKYVLHDGPPYANGNIHLGTALNKVLKDFIVKYKNMSGFCSPYVPGWDTHGLPTELKAIKKLGVGNKMSKLDIRRSCRDFALSYVDEQRNQFKRLGVLADFDDPYITLKPEFEAKEVEIFGAMAKKGHIYKGLKPVYWCPHCETALAEAEIEYAEDPCHSIYVKFQVKEDKGLLTKMGAQLDKTFFVIWTTTTWTLPGNVAICVGPAYEYCLIKANGEFYVMAKALADGAMKNAGIEEYEIIGDIAGSKLEYMVTQHPFIDRDSLVIVGDHVTLESGTGCVHTAPGHGVEDFEVCQKYPEIPIVVPVDNKGYLTDLAGQFSGMKTEEANKAIAEHLEKTGNLFAIEKIIHQYPHCWRCQSPILFRATEQWFCSIDGFKKEALEAVEDIQWIPGWGKGRISGMIEDRSDWCISRQRTWGVPIPIFYCEECGKELVTDESIQAVADLFRKEGSDAWYQYEAAEILPKGTKCPVCGCEHFTKEKDILDVWFDSGVSHAAVLAERPQLTWPCDLYLEGTDQYRGWFQSSLLTSIAWKGKAPYKAVCTHGWVVDGEGRKQSKSLGNGILPEEIIKEYGAEILRLWVASSDYHADIRISREILKQLSDNYKKIRNTARYILGNTFDFDPNTDMVAEKDMAEIDKWALMQYNKLLCKCIEGYDKFEFHMVFHAIHNFCVIDMSNFYLDVLKDRLYVEKSDSFARRSAQSAMYKILKGLTKLLAPILSFTADEIWSYMAHTPDDDAKSVFFNEIDKPSNVKYDDAFIEKWDKIHAMRDDAKKALEIARTSKIIGSSLEAKVIIYGDSDLCTFAESVQKELTDAFIVSQLEIKEAGQGEFKGDVEGMSLTVEKAEGKKCERCWSFTPSVGENSAHPDLCARCAAIVE